jgi:hypothetical protein
MGGGFVAAAWALLNFLMHRDNMGERMAWLSSAFIGFLLFALYLTMVIYMYAIVSESVPALVSLPTEETASTVAACVCVSVDIVC